MWFLFIKGYGCAASLHKYTPPTPTEDGVPYIVSIFAENSAGNGTRCNVTDFTNELSESITSVVLVVVISFSILEIICLGIILEYECQIVMNML